MAAAGEVIVADQSGAETRIEVQAVGKLMVTAAVKSSVRFGPGVVVSLWMGIGLRVALCRLYLAAGSWTSSASLAPRF